MQQVRDDDELDPMTREDSIEQKIGRTGPTGDGTTADVRGVADAPPERLWMDRSSDAISAAAFHRVGAVRSHGEVKHADFIRGKTALGRRTP